MRSVRLSLGLAATTALLALGASTAAAATFATGPATGTRVSPSTLPSYTATSAQPPGTVAWTATGPGTATPAAGSGLSFSVTSVTPPSAGAVYTVRVEDIDGFEERTFIFDSTGPTAPTLAVSANPTNDTTPTFTWSGATGTGSGIVGYQASVNGAGFINLGNVTSWTPGLAQGTYAVVVRGVDALGNPGSPSNTVNLRVDTSAPPVPGSLSPASGFATTDTTPLLDWATISDGADPGGSGIAFYRVQVDGPGGLRQFDRTPSNVTVTPALPDGTFTWRVRSRDNAGNFSAYTADRTFVVDTSTPPAPTFTEIPGAFTRDTTPTFRWADTPGMSYTYVVRNSGGTAIQGPTSTGGTAAATVLPLTPNAFYSFEVFQTNAAGTSGPARKTSFTLDTVAPAAPTLTALPPSPSTDPNPAFSWSAGEAGATFRWQVLNSDLQAIKNGSTGGTTVTVNALPAGNLRFRLWQVDRAGNASSITETAFVIRNPAQPKAKPTATFVKPRTRNVRLLKPGVGKKVTTRTITLKWRKPTRDTVLYNVQLFRMNGRRLTKIHTAFPRGIRYRLPAKLLRPNRRYVWQVWAYRGPEKGYQSRPIGISYFDKLKTRVPAKILSPKARHVAGKKLSARWRPAPRTRYYQVLVYRGNRLLVRRRITRNRVVIPAKLLRPVAGKYRFIVRRGLGAPKSGRYAKKAWGGKKFSVVKPK